jgi:hypothetical protein
MISKGILTIHACFSLRSISSLLPRFAFESTVSPRAYLPVQLIEARIVRDLCTNLLAIRDFVSSSSSTASSSEKVTIA